MNLDQLGILVGAILTVLIFSYLLGDNFLYRLATHILIGAAAAYVTVTVLADVLWARIVMPIITLRAAADPTAAMVIAAVTAGLGAFFGILLLLKLWPRLAFVGNIPIGYLVGVGAAVALGGAVFGTLGPQVVATAAPPGGLFSGATANPSLNFILNVIVLFVTLTTLLSFGFNRAARGGVMSGINSLGRFFLAIALGATFALVYVASVTLMVDRVQEITDAIGVIQALVVK